MAERYWLIDSVAKQQLSKYALDKAKHWSNTWGFSFSEEWNIKISQHIGLKEFSVKSLSLYSGKDQKLSFGMKAIKAKPYLAKEIVRCHLPSESSPLLNSVIQKSLNSLQEIFDENKNTGKDREVLSKGDTLKCVGTVQIDLVNRQFTISLFLSLGLIDMLIDKLGLVRQGELKEHPSSKIFPRIISIGNEMTHLKVDYATASISVEELSTIRIGDVIRLDECLKTPMSIYDQYGQRLCGGYLGTKNGQLALKITKED